MRGTGSRSAEEIGDRRDHCPFRDFQTCNILRWSVSRPHARRSDPQEAWASLVTIGSRGAVRRLRPVDTCDHRQGRNVRMPRAGGAVEWRDRSISGLMSGMTLAPTTCWHFISDARQYRDTITKFRCLPTNGKIRRRVLPYEVSTRVAPASPLVLHAIVSQKACPRRQKRNRLIDARPWATGRA